MKKLLIVIAVSTTFNLSTAHSSGIPVIDVASIQQQIIDYGQQYEQIVKQIEQLQSLKQQYEQQLKSFKAMVTMEWESCLIQQPIINSETIFLILGKIL